MKHLWLCLLLTALPAHAGLLGKLGKLGRGDADIPKAGGKLDGHQGVKFGDSIGAGQYADAITLPAAGIFLGKKLGQLAEGAIGAADIAMEIGEQFGGEDAGGDGDGDAANKDKPQDKLQDKPGDINQQISATSETMSKEALQSLFEARLLMPAEALPATNQIAKLLRAARMRTKRESIYVGASEQQFDGHVVTQVICKTEQQWQRFTTLQPFVSMVVQTQCGISKPGNTFLNHAAYANNIIATLGQLSRNQAIYQYKNNKVALFPVRTDAQGRSWRRLDGCCVHADQSFHPSIQGMLENEGGSNYKLIAYGIGDGKFQQRITELGGIVVADEAAYKRHRLRNHLLIHSTSVQPTHSLTLAVTDANIQAVFNQLGNISQSDMTKVNSQWAMAVGLGIQTDNKAAASKTVSTQSSKTQNSKTQRAFVAATKIDNNSAHYIVDYGRGVKIAGTLHRSENNCSPYIWDCSDYASSGSASAPSTGAWIMLVIGLIVGIVVIWKMLSLWEKYIAGPIRSKVWSAIKGSFSKK